MYHSPRFAGILKSIVRLSPGALLYGSSCASEIEDALVSAGLDFIEVTAENVLAFIFPISETLAEL